MIEITKEKYKAIVRGIKRIFPEMEFPEATEGLEFRLKGKDYIVI